MEQYGAGDYFNPWIPNDPFSNHHNQNWENHSNFFWNSQTGQNSVGQIPGFQQAQKSRLESLMENFVLTQTKQNEEFRRQHQGSFGQRMQGDPFSNRYNSGWRSHPNFSYGSSQNPIGQSSIRPPPGFQQQNQKSNLETLMENFISSQTKLNEECRQQNQEMCDAIIKLGAKVESLATHNKMLEIQIAQQASTFDDQSSIFHDEAEFDLSNSINHPSVENSCYETDTLHLIIEEGTPIYHPENPDEGSFINYQAADGVHVQKDSFTLPQVEIEKPMTHLRELRSEELGPNYEQQVFSYGTAKTKNEEGGRSMAIGQRSNQHLDGESIGKAVPRALIRPFDPGGPKRGQA